MFSIQDPSTSARRILDEFAKCTPTNVEPGISLFSPSGKFYALANQSAWAGHSAMRAGFQQLFDEIRDIKYELREVSATGNVLFVERVENFTYKGRRVESLAACGVAVFGEDGRLVEFRDYYDTGVLERENKD